MLFSSRSPINVERLKGQNKRLYDYLDQGNTIHVFDPAKQDLKIGYLNSRISDLVKSRVEIFKRFIVVEEGGESVTVKQYSMRPFPCRN